jgi:alkylation response protein AidB-like acyl-CoA dehydrogenase
MHHSQVLIGQKTWVQGAPHDSTVVAARTTIQHSNDYHKAHQRLLKTAIRAK